VVSDLVASTEVHELSYKLAAGQESSLLQGIALRKSFGGVEAVREASLTVMPGQFVAVMGRSGSGKTTLLHLLAGLERPTAGQILFRGREIGGLDEDGLALWRRDNVGMVFQAFHLVPTLSALENVAFPLYPLKMTAAERRKRAAANLALVGLSDRAGHRPSRLSGGEQQRVAIARALVNKPTLVLGDEPTGNLDSATGDEIMVLFTRLRSETGVALLMVTHDDKVAAAADRVLHMIDGRLSNGNEA
jgi:putative ABC transport system ATP-binding protein